jgi:hypothetical protein
MGNITHSTIPIAVQAAVSSQAAVPSVASAESRSDMLASNGVVWRCFHHKAILLLITERLDRVG